MGRYLLGVDFGGGAAKATLLTGTGVTAATASVEYPTYYPQNGWTEQSPEELFEGFVKIVREILASGIDPEDIEVLAISAASQTGVYLDESGRPVRRSIYWTDGRGAGYAERLKAECGGWIYETCCNVPSTARTAVHLLWIREHEPEAFARIAKIMFVKDYIRWRLTGDFATDFIDAMGSLLMDVPNNCWSERLCARVGISADMLPEIRDPRDFVGPIKPEMLALTGLSPGTRVIVGSTDTVMEVYANGAIHAGQMTVKLATAGRICPITEHNLVNPLLINYKHVVPGLWYPGTGTKSCAASYRWYRDNLSAGERMEAEAAGKDPYQVMDEMAADIGPCCDDLYFHPYLQGELTPYFDAALRGSFVGAASCHTKAHFNRAVLEGVAFSLKDCYTVLEQERLKIDRAIIIGGGASSPLWCQIVSDMLGVELEKTRNADSSLGSAMLAGVAAGIFRSFEESVERCVHIERRIVPDAKTNAVYERGFLRYKQIHDALAPIYAGWREQR